jgi:hypothetical protein
MRSRTLPMLLLRRDRTAALWWTEGEPREEDAMSLDAHVEELKKRHKALSDEVEAAQRSPGTSDRKIADLKKQKLRLKEEIQRLSDRIG